MIIKRIFLDVDDVLADFSLAALKHVGIDLKHVDLDSYYERFGYDIVLSANYYRKRIFSSADYTFEEFWAEFPRPFWTNLKKTEECDYLISACYKLIGKENVFLLTAPIQDPDCVAGKMEWIRKELPEFWKDRRYLIAPPKYVCASLNSLLIDDSDANVNAFRRANGMASLVPRPWNTAHARQNKGLLLEDLT